MSSSHTSSSRKLSKQEALSEKSRHGARAGKLHITAIILGAISIVTVVLYGLNNQRDENGGTQQVAAIPATPQPAPGDQAQNNKQQGQKNQQKGQQQAQSSQGGGQEPSTPSQTATEPSGPSNPSTTTGQGSNPQGSQDGNTGNKSTPPTNASNGSNSAPANSQQNASPPKQRGNQ